MSVPEPVPNVIVEGNIVFVGFLFSNFDEEQFFELFFVHHFIYAIELY